jgi:hypothetical protein
MSIVEIELARGYLARSDQDPVAALIRSVRDLARLRRLLAGAAGDILAGSADERPDRTAAATRGEAIAG